MRVDVVFEERYWYPDDGSIVWLSGYQLVDEDGRFLARDAPLLAERGLRVTGVAGAARHHDDALQSPSAAPGRTLALERGPDNAHDPDAIAVHTAGGEQQLGFVPRDVAAQIAPQLDAGTTWTAIALRESRTSPRDPRKGLTILLAPAATIELVPAARRGPPPRQV